MLSFTKIYIYSLKCLLCFYVSYECNYRVLQRDCISCAVLFSIEFIIQYVSCFLFSVFLQFVFVFPIHQNRQISLSCFWTTGKRFYCRVVIFRPWHLYGIFVVRSYVLFSTYIKGWIYKFAKRCFNDGKSWANI